MDIDQDDIDGAYDNLTSLYVREGEEGVEGAGEKAIVELFRLGSPLLRKGMIQAIREYDEEFTAEEVDFLMHALEQRISAASKKLPLTLSNEQKVQVQRFYATNAGASFINTQMRNTRLKSEFAIPLQYPDIDRAVAAAANEGVSEGNRAFSTAGRQAIKQAFALGDVEKVMRAALEGEGLHYSTPQYRGTRVPRKQLEAFRVGDLLMNAFFMSFSPDIMKPTKRGDDEKVHDGFRQARTFVSDQYKSHVGVPVIYELPERSGYKTAVIHSLYEHETVMPPMAVLAIKSITNEGTHTRICLKTKAEADADAQKTGPDKRRKVYMFH
jgi:hypothetical protein